MQITEITVGEGNEAASGRGVFVHYTVWRYEPTGGDFKGTQLDSSAGLNSAFVRGGHDPVHHRGMSQGVIGMKVGGKRRVILPPSLAYGTTGSADGRDPSERVAGVRTRAVERDLAERRPRQAGGHV